MKQLLLLVCICLSICLIIGGAGATISNVTTKLYMPMNGTEAATVFPELSHNYYFTSNPAGAVINTTTKKFGTGSAYFPGAGRLLSVNNTITAAPYSIAFWTYSPTAKATGCFIDIAAAGSNAGINVHATTGQVIVDNGVTGGTGPSGGDMPANVWNYVVIVANGTHTNLYINGTLTSQYTGTTMSGVPTATYIGAYGLTGGQYTGYIDDLVVSNVTIDGTVVPTNEFVKAVAGIPLSANFTSVPNPSQVGQSVQFTNTSTGTPTTFNWTFGDIGAGNTSTIWNPTHTYTAIGTYSVNLNVTNASGSFSDVSHDQVVTNITGFTPADIWMDGEYIQTFHITDASTGLPIVAVNLQDTAMQTYTTTNGTGYLTEPFGASTVTFVSTGYTSRAISYVFDSDATHDVQLSVAPTAPAQNTWWTPHTVQVTVMDANYGTRLYDVNIQAHYNETSMPTGWINSLYGIGSTVQADMINQTLIMSGTTGSAGTGTFTMLGSIKYDFTLNAAQYGISNYKVMEWPSDNMLNIYVLTTGSLLPTQRNSTYTNLNGTRVYFTEPDINNVSMCIDYIDTSGETSSVTFIWKFTNGTTLNTSTVNPGTGLNTICNVTRNIRGTQVVWGYNATRSVVTV